MIRSIRDLVHVRWRTAQMLAALVDDETEQVRALRQVMRIEGLDVEDSRDEMRLLLSQFGHRPVFYLREEVSRLWRKLRQLCVRCGRSTRYIGNDGVCSDCVIEES